MKKMFEKSAILLLALASVLGMGALTACSKDGGPGEQVFRPTAAIQGTWRAVSKCSRAFAMVDGKWEEHEETGVQKIHSNSKQMEIYDNGWVVLFEYGEDQFGKFATTGEFHGVFSKVEEGFYLSDEILELNWRWGINQVSDDKVETWYFKIDGDILWVEVVSYTRGALATRFAHEVENAVLGRSFLPIVRQCDVLELFEGNLWVTDESASFRENLDLGLVYQFRENGQGTVCKREDMSLAVDTFTWEQEVNRIRFKKADGTVSESFIEKFNSDDDLLSFSTRKVSADRVETETYSCMYQELK